MRLNSQQLRDIIEPEPQVLAEVRKSRLDMQWVLDDIVDTYNVGSIFRLADAVGVRRVWLCGKTECPPNPRIEKASVGTHRWVDWAYAKDAMSVIDEIKIQNPEVQIAAVEQSERSVGLDKTNLTLPLLLIVGNETEGVSEELLQRVDTIIEMPMRGINKSLNVVVSLAMVMARIDEAIR